MENATQMSRRFRRDSRFIASVYPDSPLPIDRPFDGWHTFKIDACPKGTAPQLLEVFDCFQIEPDFLQRNNKHEVLIFHEQVIGDLLKHWAATPMGAPAGCGPGIGVIAGPEPTEEEIAGLIERQTVMFTWQYHEGQRMAQQHDWRGIDRHVRLAAAWLGMDEIWARDLHKSDVEPCPACHAPISKGVYICIACGTVLRALPPELAELQPGFRGTKKAA